MTSSLAIFSYGMGASFIDKHLVDLAPGRTVAVGRRGLLPELTALWPVSCPLLQLDRVEATLAFRFARRCGTSPATLRAMVVKSFLRRHRVKVVLGEYLDGFLEFAPLLDRLGVPYVVQGHGIDVSAVLRRPGMPDAYRQAYANAKAVLTRSEFHRRRLIDIGLPAERVHVNRGGVDVPSAPIQRPVEAATRLLAIGVMVDKKAPILLLEAFRRAAQRDLALSLEYIGGGPGFDAAKQFVRACGLAGRVMLHGIAPESTKQRLLDSCGVFVQHSVTTETGDEEGLPAAIQEAMAHGMAVVSTRHAGIPEAVIEGVTGLLVDEGDVDEMSNAFLRIPDLAFQYGSNGYAEALRAHAWTHERNRLRKWLNLDDDAPPGRRLRHSEQTAPKSKVPVPIILPRDDCH